MAEHAWHAHSAPTASAAAFHDPLNIDIHRLLTGVLLVEVRGAVDHVTGAELERRLGTVPSAGLADPPRLLLDLSGVTYLDLAGLDAVLHLQERWASAAGTVELVAPSPSVVRLLHEADLDGASWMTTIDHADDDPPTPETRQS